MKKENIISSNYNHGGNVYIYNRKMVDFSANLNPLGLPKKAKEAIISSIDCLEPYPDPYNGELRKAVSAHYNIDEDKLTFGNGAADIVFKIPLLLGIKRALLLSPTFSEYEKALKLADAEVDHFFLKEEDNFIPDVDEFVKYIKDSFNKGIKYDIVFICSPNNPTGIPIEKKKLSDFMHEAENLNITVVLDQCFSDFLVDERSYSLVENINEFRNLIILKAFTKIYAMAGIRLGFAVCSSKEIAAGLSTLTQPWSVSKLASVAGAAAINEKGYLDNTKKIVEMERKYVMESLSSLGIKYYPSMVNYVLFRGDANLKKQLEDKGILIRSCKDYPTLDDTYYRIAIKLHEDNELIVKAIEECLKR